MLSPCSTTVGVELGVSASSYRNFRTWSSWMVHSPLLRARAGALPLAQHNAKRTQGYVRITTTPNEFASTAGASVKFQK